MRSFRLRRQLSLLALPSSPTSRSTIHSLTFAGSCARGCHHVYSSPMRWTSRLVSTTAAGGGGNDGGEASSSHLTTSVAGSRYSTPAFPGPLSSPPSTLPTANTDVLCLRLSRRQLRQRERRRGALWRYRLDGGSSLSGAPPMLASGTACAAPEREEAQRGYAASRLPCAHPAISRSSSSADVLDPRDATVVKSARGTLHASIQFHEEAPASSSHAAAAPASPQQPQPQPEYHDDPLRTLLESHSEDAALLLAMWTSLHRSCVYASALSESVVLQVRYILHSLVHNRAMTAAVHLYHRLLGVGVQLQHSDLLLLFSSLAYEGAAATEEAQLHRAAEQAALDKDRRIWAERRRHFSDAAQRTRAAAGAVAPATATRAYQKPTAGREERGEEAKTAGLASLLPDTCSGVPVDQTGAVSDAAATMTGDSETTQASTPGSHFKKDAAEAHPPSAIARRVAFQQQPEWVKRWILYEASMGTLDGLDGAEDPKASTGSKTADSINGGGVSAPSAEDGLSGGKAGEEEEEEETRAQSLQAARVMEVTAILDHLHLLTVGGMQRDEIVAALSSTARPQLHAPLTAAASLSSSSSSFSPRSLLSNRTHWRAALQVVRGGYAVPQLPSAATTQACDKGRSGEPAVVPLADSVALLLQAMVREVQSWEGAMAVLRLTAAQVPPSPALTVRHLEMTADAFRRGAALFVAIAAASSQPWKTQAAVEAFMHTFLLPRLAHNARSVADATHLTGASGATASAATESTHALWMSHLCGVKASRPDDFVVIAEEAAAYLGNNAAHAVLRGDLKLMTAAATAAALRAVASLRYAAQHTVQSQRTRHALATSIRTGAFRAAGSSTDEAASEQLHLPPPTSAGTSESSSAVAAEGSSDLVDAFALCCAALHETLWLRYTTAAMTDPAAVTADALKFLEQILHGPTGLYAVFVELYSTARPPHNTDNGITTVASASERGYVSCLLVVTLQRLVQLLCAPPGNPRRRFGAQLWCGAELVLLLEMCANVLSSVTAPQLRRVPWKWAAEEQVTRLVKVTAATTRTIVRELGIHGQSERALFGALPEQELELLAQLARVVSKSSELAVAIGTQTKPTPASQSRGVAARTPSPVWRALTATCSPRVLQGVQLCFHDSSALSKRVRHRLSRRDVDGLQRSIPSPRSRRRAHTSTTASASAVALVPARSFGRDFKVAVGLRDAVYAAVQGSSTSTAVGHSLEQLALSTSGWEASLMLCQLTTRGVALARGTCGMGFFAATLDRMSQDLVASRTASRQPRDKSRRASASAVRGVGPANLWLSAIDVFWTAVDHGGGVDAAAAHSNHATQAVRPLAASCSAPASSLLAVPGSATTADERERVVLAQLLQPLLRFSRAVRRRDVGLEWRRAWAAQYTSAERHSPQWRRQNIEALSLLGEPAALTRCVAEFDVCADEELLCDVALRHGDWHAALDALFKTCGTLEAQLAASRRYSPPVAHTVLQLLGRSPMNLSNTAMRVRTLQAEAWDAACSLEVVELLLRARRWRLALQYVEDALELPAMAHVKALLLIDPAGAWRHSKTEKAPEESSLTHYALLLTRALQATAIGGDEARAPAYYDAFKALHRFVFAMASHGGADEARAVDADGVDEAADGLLGDALAMAHSSPQVANPRQDTRGVGGDDSVRLVMSELAPRARMHFFRAMTKKLLTTVPSDDASRAEDTSYGSQQTLHEARRHKDERRE